MGKPSKQERLAKKLRKIESGAERFLDIAVEAMDAQVGFSIERHPHLRKEECVALLRSMPSQ